MLIQSCWPSKSMIFHLEDSIKHHTSVKSSLKVLQIKQMCHRTATGLVSLFARTIISCMSVLKVKKHTIMYLESYSHLLELCHLLQSLYLYCTWQGKSEHSAVFTFFLSLNIFMCMKSNGEEKHLCFYCDWCTPSLANKLYYTTVYCCFRCITASCFPNYTISMLNSLALFY